jgi:hypothetical protein
MEQAVIVHLSPDVSDDWGVDLVEDPLIAAIEAKGVGSSTRMISPSTAAVRSSCTPTGRTQTPSTRQRSRYSRTFLSVQGHTQSSGTAKPAIST